MLARRNYTGILLALGAVTALACASASPSVPSGPDAGVDATSTSRVEIGTRGDGATFTVWSDGEIVPLVWGPQGGVMVTPAVAIDGALVTDVDPALTVELANYDGDTGERLAYPGYGPVQVLFARLDRRLVNGPIFDQLGVTDLGGRAVRITARVTGRGVDAAGEVRITLGGAGEMPPSPG